ncbi:MAG: RiPP maturation radical SAM C-methyltransferase [Desulfobacterales bacterium]|nr:MAG: RiPP maturation radical SAM C-methyltransferase [Desulfobacterales bacterium]
MMQRVLLVNMPFASVRYPSPALSLLRSLVEREGVSCDVAYLNIFFQAATGRPEIYEGIADFMIIGEAVFGAELFGAQWAQTERGSLAKLAAPLLPDGAKLRAIRNSLLALRSKAGPFIRECLRTINWNDYGVIGFTSVYSQHVASLALARHIKQNWPEKIIAFGGANCEEEMGQALLRLFPFVDWVFNGEADLSFPQAVTGWFAGKPPEGIPGVAYRTEGRIIAQGTGRSPEMDGLPYPDFKDYFAALNQWAPAYRPMAPISLELSRGCWWGKKSQCIFCGLNCRALNYRRKSASRAESEIKTLTARFEVERVILTDSVVDMSFFKTLLPALAKWGGLEELFLEAKANLSREQVRVLQTAGVKLFQPGIESLDTEILSLMRKGTTLLQNVQFLKWAREYGLYPTWNLLYGFPGENAAAYDRMAALIPLISHLCPPMDVSPMLLVRFSPLFEQRGQWGLQNVRAHAGYASVYPFDPQDLDELAYFFDFNVDGQADIPAYIGPLKQRVQDWKQSWKQPHPPALTFQQQPGERVVIFDTRPCRLDDRLDLEGALAAAYAACDAMRPVAALASDLREQCGTSATDENSLRQGLDELVARGLMLREGDHYLSLALSHGYDWDVSEEW